MSIISNPCIVPIPAPNPDKKLRKWSRSWKSRRNRYGNRVKKVRQYGLVDMSIA